MASVSLSQATSAVSANTAAAPNTIPLRDNQGGVTHNAVAAGLLTNSGAEVWAHTAIKTAAYAIASPSGGTGGDRVIYYNTTGGAFPITFPLASAVDGRILTLVNATNSTTALTLTMSGSDTCTNATLTTANGYATYQSDGVSAWTRIG
jgi:hypothetical protein